MTMKLYSSPTSPYARKVIMLARVAGLDDLELVPTNPMQSDALRSANPLGKIPALVDGDLKLFDSPLICEYLDDIHQARGGRSFFQRGSPAYYHNQSLHALGQGILDAAVAAMYEKRRPDSTPSAFWLERRQTAVRHAVASVADIASLGSPDNPHIGTFSVLAALGYLDFRFDDWQWRQWNAPLGQWYQSFNGQAWFAETAPKDKT